MRASTNLKRRSFIRVVLVCFFLSAIVSGRPIYAVGKVVAWGDRKPPDQPLTNLTQIAAGWLHSLGLKTDGSIVAWGGNWDGQCNVPLPNTGFTAIAGGESYSLGLRGCMFDLAWDLNNDCRVELRDFAELADDWPISYDVNDLAEMAEDWLIDCDVTPGDPACVPK
jgi:hypothetical protein